MGSRRSQIPSGVTTVTKPVRQVGVVVVREVRRVTESTIDNSCLPFVAPKGAAWRRALTWAGVLSPFIRCRRSQGGSDAPILRYAVRRDPPSIARAGRPWLRRVLRGDGG